METRQNIDDYVSHVRESTSGVESLNNETTMFRLVHPLVDLLDWPMKNIEREYSLQLGNSSKRIDYALLSDDSPEVFIESRNYPDNITDKDRKELSSCLRVGVVDFGILTNGRKIELYGRHPETEDANKELYWSIDLEKGSRDRIVNKILGLQNELHGEYAPTDNVEEDDEAIPIEREWLGEQYMYEVKNSYSSQIPNEIVELAAVLPFSNQDGPSDPLHVGLVGRKSFRSSFAETTRELFHNAIYVKVAGGEIQYEVPDEVQQAPLLIIQSADPLTRETFSKIQECIPSIHWSATKDTPRNIPVLALSPLKNGSLDSYEQLSNQIEIGHDARDMLDLFVPVEMGKEQLESGEISNERIVIPSLSLNNFSENETMSCEYCTIPISTPPLQNSVMNQLNAFGDEIIERLPENESVMGTDFYSVLLRLSQARTNAYGCDEIEEQVVEDTKRHTNKILRHLGLGPESGDLSPNWNTGVSKAEMDRKKGFENIIKDMDEEMDGIGVDVDDVTEKALGVGLVDEKSIASNEIENLYQSNDFFEPSPGEIAPM